MLAVKKEQDCKFYSVQEKTPTPADLIYTTYMVENPCVGILAIWFVF